MTDMYHDVFAEQVVKRKVNRLVKPLSILALSFSLLFFLAIIILLPVLMLSYRGLAWLVVSDIYLLVMGWMGLSMSDVEYEYCNTNGEIEIFSIQRNSRRKALAHFHVNDIVAAGSKKQLIDGSYEGRIKKTIEAWSRNTDTQLYGIVFQRDGRLEKLWFEPDDDFLKAMKIQGK